MLKKGLLLINLGTPTSFKPKDVQRFLGVFLTDKRVIDLSAWMRYLLVYCILLPFRTRRSARAYEAIWGPKESPLLTHSNALQAQLQRCLGSQWKVALGMRYGNPSLPSALQQLQECAHVTVLPLYPQYSSAATGSALECVLKYIASQEIIPHLTIIRDFYNHPAFINAQAELIKPYLSNHEHLLLSYHGLPLRQLKKSGCALACTDSCTVNTNNVTCYRAQCYLTTQALVQLLPLKITEYSVSFQSRLGKTPWIKPYTEDTLVDLAQKGIKRLAIVCPSFITDCLETLEEIGIQAQNHWKDLGGECLTLIPCLNSNELWIKSLEQLLHCPNEV